MLYPLIGASGTGKTSYIIERIRELCQAGEQVLLLVPEQFSFEMERRILLEVGAQSVGHVEVKSFSHFCRKVFMEYGGAAGERISDAARRMLMQISLDEIRDQLEQYGRAAARSGFAASALQLVDQFKNAGVQADDLQNFAALCGEERLSRKCDELYQIYAVYQAHLEQGFVDEREDLARAVELLRGKNYFENLHVFLDSFRDFTPIEREMISVIMDSCKGIYLSILSKNLEIKGKNTEQLESDVFKIVKENALHIISEAKQHNFPVAAPQRFPNAHRYQSEDLRWLAEMLTQLQPEAYDGPCKDLKIYQAADPYEELRYTAAQIVRLIKNEGYHYRDFTIIVRSLEKYQTPMEQLFRRYDIPLFWDARMDIRHVALIRGLLSALDAVAEGYSTEHILAFAKSPLMALDSTAVLELENYCYTWNIKKEQWLRPFEANPRGISPVFKEEDREELARINAAAETVMAPLRRLKEHLEAADGLAFAAAVYAFLNGIDARANLAAAFGREDLHYADILQQNSEAWDILMDLLDTMANILRDHVLPLDQLLELFRSALQTCDFGSIPNTLDQVSVGTADRIRPNEPKVVFVLGMNQGEFPPQLTEQPFFTDGERETLLASGIQIGPTIIRQNDYEQLYLYSALTAASHKLYLSYHMTLSDGSECAPSALLQSILTLTDRRPLIRREQLGDLFFAVNDSTAFECLCSNYHQDNPLLSALDEHIRSSREARRLEQVESVLAREDFALDDQRLARELFGTIMRLSPTTVNKYFSCPFSYFCYSGLHLRSRKRADYSALEAGNLLHHLLAEMVERHGGKGLSQLTLTQMEAESQTIVDKYLEEVVGGSQQLRQRSRYLFRNLAHRATFILKQLAEEFAQSEFEPLYCELPIRQGSKVPPVVFETEEGIQLSIEGIVDRVDVMEKKGRRYARVIDYKSGGQSFSFTEMYNGLKLQMLLYLLSICENGSGKLKDAVPAGVLYFPATDAALSVDRNSSDESIKTERRKHYKMKGLVLEDEDCIFGMEQPQIKVKKGKKGEPDTEQKLAQGNYIPAVSTSSGGWHATRSTLANEAQMKLMFKHIRHLMTDMAQNLGEGNIPAIPKGSKSQKPCDYCEFRAICQHQDGDKQDILTTLKKEECFSKMEEKYNDEEGGVL